MFYENTVRPIAPAADERSATPDDTDTPPWTVEWAADEAFCPDREDDRPGLENTAAAMAIAALTGRPVVVTAARRGTVRVRDLATGEHYATLSGHRECVNVVATAFVRGQPTAVTGSVDGSVRTWDLATGRQTRPGFVFPRGVNALSLSPDGCVTVGFDSELGVL
ncbi:WD40 repeat domain-containing protein [Streptomyces sp. NPDC001617]